MPLPPFDFFSVPHITFGAGKLSALPQLAAPLGGVVLLLHNGGCGPLERVSVALKGTNIRLVAHRQKGEPIVADVDAALAAARDAGCTGVIGAGGGSAIDAAKAVAGLLANGGSALDYMEVIGRGQKLTKPAIPWIAIPATAGTGAEVTRNAVIGEPSKKFKASLRSELLLPRAAIIDPEMQLDLPPNPTAWSGMDALCQCIESYTSTGANPLTDALALHGVSLAAANLPLAFANGSDLAARAGMATAALISGITLTNAGLGAVHGFAAPLGANFDVPHGAVCAALLPHVIAANVMAAGAGDDHRAIDRYADIGRAISGKWFLEQDQALSAAIAGTQSLARDLGIPPLKKFGVTTAAVPEMVALAKKASSMKFNPVVLSDATLSEILTRAIEGT
jgi:alcohol dehydrogenase class IV